MAHAGSRADPVRALLRQEPIRYDNFEWQIYKTDHFEIYYYPEIEPHLERMAGYAESAYQHISSELKHDLAGQGAADPVLRRAAEFYQQNVIPGRRAGRRRRVRRSRSRYRILMPMDEPPDLLYRLMVHELTHIFQFDIIPTSLIRNNMPLWVNEGMSDYMTGMWRPIDLMTVRDAAIADIVPKMSQLQGYGNFGNLRGIYNLGHAAFEFMEARWGKEGVRQFVFALRKSIIGGGDDAYPGSVPDDRRGVGSAVRPLPEGALQAVPRQGAAGRLRPQPGAQPRQDPLLAVPTRSSRRRRAT